MIRSPPVAFAPKRGNFDIEVTLAKASLLYEPATVSVDVSPKSVGRDDVEVWLSLPQHAVLLDGEAAWHGPLYPGDTKTLTATIAFLKEGNTYVGVQAEYPSPEHRPNRLVGDAYLDLNIGKTSSQLDRLKEEYVQQVSWLGNDPDVRPFSVTPIIWNTSSIGKLPAERRVFTIDSVENLKALQAQGLIPSVLRYQWRELAKHLQYLDRMFFVAVYHSPQAGTQSWINVDTVPGFEELGQGLAVWDHGIVRMNLNIDTADISANQPYSETATVTVFTVERPPLFTPMDFGPQPLLFTFNDGEPIQLNMDFPPRVAPVVEVPPILTETSTPMPVYGGSVVVEITSTVLTQGQQAQLPLTIRAIDAPGGLGAYDMTVTFDPSAVAVVEILPGDGPFGAPLAQNIDNDKGFVIVVGIQASEGPGSKEDTVPFYLVVKAVGASGASTAFGVTINTLVDTDGVDISTTAQDGLLQIQ